MVRGWGENSFLFLVSSFQLQADREPRMDTDKKGGGCGFIYVFSHVGYWDILGF